MRLSAGRQHLRRLALNAPAPLISVIVPVYNVAGFVGPCLDSLRRQSLADFEAIVIDDGSTDASRAEIVARVAGDPRFRVFAGLNGGLSAARNTGLALARGAFIAFLDGDDRYDPDFLAKMHAALQNQGADWVACGLTYVQPDAATGTGHSAIHGAPDLAPDQGARAVDLTDWREVVRHFPSAWNKLYRRDLIAGLRFDEGTYYEDHAFFWQVAGRSRRMLHLPEALVLHTVGRPGQITRDGGERVFQQFTVLERLREILDGLPDRPGRDQAFRRVAVRLIFERGAALGDPHRRARFARAALDFFAGHAITWQDEVETPRLDLFARCLLGRRALTVVVPSDGQEPPLRATLESLVAQDFGDFDILVVPDGKARLIDLARAAEAAGAQGRVTILGPDPAETIAEAATWRVAAARNRGLAAARGDFVVFLDAGDWLLPWALDHWLVAMTGVGGAEGADLGFSAFRHGHAEGAVHGGVHDATPFAELVPGGALDPVAVLALHALPSAKIYRRGFLTDLSLEYASHPLQSWQFLLQAAMAAKAVVRLPGAGVVLGEAPGMRQFWHAPLAARDLRDTMAELTAALETGAETVDVLRLWARAIWERVLHAQGLDGAARREFRTDLRQVWQDLRAEVPAGVEVFDPYVSVDFRQFLAGETDLP